MKVIFKNRYMLFATITFILSMAACIYVYQWTMKMFNITVEIIQLVCALISLGCILHCIYKRRNVTLYKTVAQALVCFILGELYWVLHMYVKGYEQLGSFSISDLSWIGFYILLLSADYSVLRPLLISNDRSLRKYKIIALTGPLFITTSSILLYLSGDSIFYTIIYLIPTSFLSYFTLMYIILPNNDSRPVIAFRRYNVVIGLILLLDNLVCLSTVYGFEDPESILKFCFAMMILLIVPAVYRGVEKCQTF